MCSYVSTVLPQVQRYHNSSQAVMMFVALYILRQGKLNSHFIVTARIGLQIFTKNTVLCHLVSFVFVASDHRKWN